jgi:hypothetical protein
MNYQLFPPRCHRANSAERAIKTFKEHFKSGLATVDPAFPIHLWDRLLSQAEITLNLLRSSRLHPQMSAAAHYHGLNDYNKTAFLSIFATLPRLTTHTYLVWAPIHVIIQGYLFRKSYLHYGPHFTAQGKATREARLCSKVTVQQHHAKARYASVRCQTAKHRKL